MPDTPIIDAAGERQFEYIIVDRHGKGWGLGRTFVSYVEALDEFNEWGDMLERDAVVEESNEATTGELSNPARYAYARAQREGPYRIYRRPLVPFEQVGPPFTFEQIK